MAISVVGADRPGIVAEVAAELVAHGADVEDSAMTLLRGRFAMVLVVALPVAVAASEVEVALSARLAPRGLVTHVEVLSTGPDLGHSEGVRERASASRWALSVHGADRPGIVAAVTAVLAGHQVNIVGLTTRVVGTDDDVYVMLLELDVPAGVDVDAVRFELAEAAERLGVAWRLYPSEGDEL